MVHDWMRPVAAIEPSLAGSGRLYRGPRYNRQGLQHALGPDLLVEKSLIYPDHYASSGGGSTERPGTRRLLM